jgi:hypothetical protein
MRKVHPLIEALVTAFYGGGSLEKQIEAFLKDFENVTGYRINIQNPDAGIFWFVKQKWGLPFDALIHFLDLKETLRKKKHKRLKKESVGILIGSVIIQGLRLLEKEVGFKSLFNYKTESLDAKKEAEKFRKLFTLEQEILTFEKLRSFLEEQNVPVFALPIDKKSEEGICNPDKYVFILINSYNPKILSGFLLAHELGHLIFNGKSSEEESFANKFGTYLIISPSVGEQIKKIYESYKRERKQNIHRFISSICKEFSCKIHPQTALAFLRYEELLSQTNFKKLQKATLQYIRKKETENIRVEWLKILLQPVEIYISKKYKQLIENLFQQRKISDKRKKELLLEDYLQCVEGSSAAIPQ